MREIYFSLDLNKDFVYLIKVTQSAKNQWYKHYKYIYIYIYIYILYILRCVVWTHTPTHAAVFGNKARTLLSWFSKGEKTTKNKTKQRVELFLRRSREGNTTELKFPGLERNGCGLDVPPHTNQTGDATTWHEPADASPWNHLVVLIGTSISCA